MDDFQAIGADAVAVARCSIIREDTYAPLALVLAVRDAIVTRYRSLCLTTVNGGVKDGSLRAGRCCHLDVSKACVEGVCCCAWVDTIGATYTLRVGVLFGERALDVPNGAAGQPVGVKGHGLGAATHFEKDAIPAHGELSATGQREQTVRSRGAGGVGHFAGGLARVVAGELLAAEDEVGRAREFPRVAGHAQHELGAARSRIEGVRQTGAPVVTLALDARRVLAATRIKELALWAKSFLSFAVLAPVVTPASAHAVSKHAVRVASQLRAGHLRRLAASSQAPVEEKRVRTG